MMHFPDTHPFEIIHLKETNSTSSCLRELRDKGLAKEFTVVIADYQTAGRGQRGNSWEAEDGKNLLFSLLLHPSFLSANRQFLLSQIVSLSIKEELDTYADGISIKWPNDIYWKERKICGILIENDLQDGYISQSISGIGININQSTFLSPAPNPVSLLQITGSEQDCPIILINIMKRLHTYYLKLQQGHSDRIAKAYYNSLFRKDMLSRYSDKNGIFFAKIIRVEPSGLLVLSDQSGEERQYAFKEISYTL